MKMLLIIIRRLKITIIRWLKKNSFVYKKLNDQKRLGNLKTMDSKSVIQTIEVNLASCTRKISGELGISEPCVVCYLNDLGKNTRNCWILPHVQPKYNKTFESLT